MRSVDVVLGRRRVLTNFSLSIAKGEIVGIEGPNGAGKTSTIRMMIGITLPDSGQVRMFGEPFRRDHLKRIGYLPETSGLYKKMKVSEQLILFGQLRGLSVVDAAARCKGVGRALVEEARVWARRSGFQSVVVRSNVVRPEAHPFYEQLGFRRTKTTHVYTRDP